MGAASGAIGSAVASHNKGGQYLRARVVPSGAVPTFEQAIVRNSLASLAAAWSAELTPEQRDAWTNYALNVPGVNRLGDSIQLSGQNWYIACNTPRLQNALARVDDAPTIFDRGNLSLFPEIILLNDSAGTFILGATITAPATALLYMGRPFSVGRNKYYGSFRLTADADLTAGLSQSSFTPAFIVGSSANQVAFNLVISYDDGRLSTPFRLTFPGF